jgi:hypothetical protein
MNQPRNTAVAAGGRADLSVSTTPGAPVMLLDVSGSMSRYDDNDSLLRRIDHLAVIVQDTLREAPEARVVVFGQQVRENCTGPSQAPPWSFLSRPGTPPWRRRCASLPAGLRGLVGSSSSATASQKIHRRP